MFSDGPEVARLIAQEISHYRIIERLGAGGMGEVFLAQDVRLDRKVAIKMLPARSIGDEQAKKRLFREAKAAATLDHPNIRLLEMKEGELPSEMQFHQRMMEIFASTRDLHTMYLLPAPFKDHVAYLPFLIEQYFEGSRKGGRVGKFMVSRVVKEFYQSIPNAGPEVLSFEPGVGVLYWNGVPIKRAIELNGESQAGSNIDARFARGLDNLTIRPLETSLPPDELWVNITYRSRTGKIFTLNQEWLVHTTGAAGTPRLASKSTRKKRAAIDIKKTKINQVRKTLFAPRDVRVRKSLQRIFHVETKKVDEREFGYIRLFSFDVDNPDQFVKEFAV